MKRMWISWPRSEFVRAIAKSVTLLVGVSFSPLLLCFTARGFFREELTDG